MPIEGRRIGYDAERVVVNLQALVQRLDHHRLAATVMHDEVHRRRLPDRFDHHRHQHDLVEIGLDLVDIGEIAKKPIGILVRRHRARRVLLGGVRIAGIAREIEQAHIESLIVDAVDDRGHALGIGAGETVFGLVADALAAIGQ